MHLAVISPFLDRAHGTERNLIEQLERFPVGGEMELHIYAQRLQDLSMALPYRAGKQLPAAQPGKKALWHRVPTIPGPHLLQYIFWFHANRICRWWDAKYRNLKCELTYSPGINASDADCIAVHMVFHEFHRLVISELSFRRNPVAHWPRLLHRRLYYRLIMVLEKTIYANTEVALAAVSSLVAEQMDRYFERTDVRVIRHGVDAERLSPSRKLARRASARQEFGLRAEDFALLLIGNDWKVKGLDGLLCALPALHDLPWKLLVVGNDVRGPYQRIIRDSGLSDRVSFLATSPDVLQFYAAADAYVGPSLQDSYGLPVVEAMSCGLPVISSSRAGVSEIIENGVNGLILCDPSNTHEISFAIRSLISNPDLCLKLGAQARQTALKETWDRNAQATWDWLNEALRRKRGLPPVGS